MNKMDKVLQHKLQQLFRQWVRLLETKGEGWQQSWGIRGDGAMVCFVHPDEKHPKRSPGGVFVLKLHDDETNCGWTVYDWRNETLQDGVDVDQFVDEARGDLLWKLYDELKWMYVA